MNTPAHADHTHLSSVQISETGAIQFNFAPSTEHGIAGMGVSSDHQPDRLAAQLQMLAALGAAHPKHTHAVAQHPGMEQVAELYKPTQEPKKDAVAAGAGGHVARYMQEQQAASMDGPPVR